MKATGIVRNLDELGRICIPIETRRALNIKERDPVEIFVEDDAIILKKRVNTCVFCGNTTELTQYEGCCICGDCVKKIGSMAAQTVK